MTGTGNTLLNWWDMSSSSGREVTLLIIHRPRHSTGMGSPLEPTLAVRRWQTSDVPQSHTKQVHSQVIYSNNRILNTSPMSVDNFLSKSPCKVSNTEGPVTPMRKRC